MPTSKNPDAFPDARAFLDRAMAAENGTVVWMETKGRCQGFLIRCRTLKKLERKRSQEMHVDNPQHPMFDKSPWDEIVFYVVPHSDKSDDRWGVKALHDRAEILSLLDFDVEDL